jgi:hypothetical protein
MSEKLTCPGCNTHTSQRLAELQDGRPCSSCGLSAAATEEILTVRARWSEGLLREQLEAALVRAGKAEGERDTLRRRLEHVRFALENALEEDLD